MTTNTEPNYLKINKTMEWNEIKLIKNLNNWLFYNDQVESKVLNKHVVSKWKPNNWIKD